MDIVASIENFFDMLSSYIELLKGYLAEDEFMDLLMYLFNSLPGEIQAIFIFSVLILLLVIAFKLFKK